MMCDAMRARGPREFVYHLPLEIITMPSRARGVIGSFSIY